MANVTTPTYTAGVKAAILASTPLAASGTTTFDVDASAIFEAQVIVTNTPGAAVSATRGLRIDVYRLYGTTPTLAPSPYDGATLPSQTALTDESQDFFPRTGKYRFKLTNLDAAQGVTVEATLDKVSNLSTT